MLIRTDFTSVLKYRRAVVEVARVIPHGPVDDRLALSAHRSRPEEPEPTVAAVLDAAEGVRSFHHRVLRRSGASTVLDHLLSTPAGGFLVEERDWAGAVSVQGGSLVRHRTGAAGEWAGGCEDATLDTVRRRAESVESVVTRPVEPVLVLTDAATSFTDPLVVRGVLVLGIGQLESWLEGLPATVDRADQALLAARLDKAFRPVDEPRRIPAWQDQPQQRRWRREARGAVPVNGGPGPRDYSLPALLEPRPSGCPAPAPVGVWGAGRRRRGRAGRALAVLLVTGALVSAAWGSFGGGWPGEATQGWRQWLPGSGDAAQTVPSWSVAGGSGETQSDLVLASCATVSLPRLGSVVGLPLERRQVHSPTQCDYGPVDGDPEVVLVSVTVGAGALTPTWRQDMGSLTAHAGSPAADGSKRTLSTPVRVDVHGSLFDEDGDGRALAHRVLRELVASSTPRQPAVG